MQQIELIFTCWCSCHLTNVMSFQSRIGSLFACVFFPFSAWVTDIDRGGQGRRNEALSSLPFPILAGCRIPSPSSRVSLQSGTCHFLYVQLSWCGTAEPFSCCLEGFKPGHIQTNKKILPMNFSFLENSQPQHTASVPQCHCVIKTNPLQWVTFLTLNMLAT